MVVRVVGVVVLQDFKMEKDEQGWRHRGRKKESERKKEALRREEGRRDSDTDNNVNLYSLRVCGGGSHLHPHDRSHQWV